MSLNYVRQKTDPRKSGKVTETKLDGNLGFKVVPKALWPVWDLERGVRRSVETSTAGRTSVTYAVELAHLLEEEQKPSLSTPTFLLLEMTDECCRKSFGSSLFESAARFMQDPTPAPSDVKDQRLAICGECEHNKNGMCQLCGCVLQLKAGFSNMRCPADKWLEHK